MPVGHRAQVRIPAGRAEAVDHAATTVGRQVQRQHTAAEGLAQLLHHPRAVGLFVIDLVDHDHPAQAAFGGPLHQAHGAVGYAGVGIDHDQRRFHRRQCRQRRAAEFRVAGGVDQVEVDAAPAVGGGVDRGDGDVHRMAARLFHRVEIRHRGAAFDRACRGQGAAGMQQGFEQGCFAGAGVACEGHVADVAGCVGHEAVPPVCGSEGPSWLSGPGVPARRLPHGCSPGRVPGGRSWRTATLTRRRRRRRCSAQRTMHIVAIPASACSPGRGGRRRDCRPGPAPE